MDEELKVWFQGALQGVEDRTAASIAAERVWFQGALQGVEDRTAAVIAAEVGSLHTQIKQSEDRLSSRFDSIDARLKLQAGLIQSGARAMARFSAFSESSEECWVALASRVEVLERKLEGK
jgi:hypothetical protein